MMTSPNTTQQPYPPIPPASSVTSRPARPARFGLFFGIVATLLTLGAIALAFFAPQLTSAPRLQIPQGWQQVYSANPHDASAVWDDTHGCSFPPEGMDVSSEGACAFKPADAGNLSGGMLVDAQLAPAADVSLSQDAGILLDNSVQVIIAQSGDYKICSGSCDVFTGSDASVTTGSTVAWHSDALVPNDIAILYNDDQSALSFYVNGQFVNQVPVNISSTPSVALNTSTTGEAIFTHVAIYVGSA